MSIFTSLKEINSFLGDVVQNVIRLLKMFVLLAVIVMLYRCVSFFYIKDYRNKHKDAAMDYSCNISIVIDEKFHANKPKVLKLIEFFSKAKSLMRIDKNHNQLILSQEVANNLTDIVSGICKMMQDIVKDQNIHQRKKDSCMLLIHSMNC
jgi:hypothetical protein